MKILRNQDLKQWNSFKTGGEADIIYLPENQDEIIKLADSLHYNFYIIGSGTNLLVSDKRIKKPIICTKDLNSYKVRIYTVRGMLKFEITVEPGVLNKTIVEIALNNSITGFEFLDGIPGTIGGAIYGNSGSGGRSVSKAIIESTILSCRNNITTSMRYNIGESFMGFSRRHSDLQNRGVVLLSAVLEGRRFPKDRILLSTKRLRNIRAETQPLNFPSAGTVFRYPDYVKEAHPKIKVKSNGDAIISELNPGFILNKGNATSEDIYLLIESVRKETIEIIGKDPELEIQLLGEM